MDCANWNGGVLGVRLNSFSSPLSADFSDWVVKSLSIVSRHGGFVLHFGKTLLKKHLLLVIMYSCCSKLILGESLVPPRTTQVVNFPPIRFFDWAPTA